MSPEANATARAVIVVEDDPGVRKAMSRMLSVGGYAALAFASAEELLRLPALPRAICMVCDVQLPRMDGFALYARLEAAGPVPPVLFITAWEDATTRTRAAEGPTRHFLTKPFSGRALLEAVARLSASAGDPRR